MAGRRSYRVTIHLDEIMKHESYRMWSQLIALDVCVLEEHQKSGVIVAEGLSEDVSLILAIPGVVAAHARLETPEDGPKETKKANTKTYTNGHSRRVAI